MVKRPAPSGVMILGGRAHRGICSGMACRTKRRQAVKIEVRAPLGALADAVDLEAAQRPQAGHLQRARKSRRASLQSHTDDESVRYEWSLEW